jgi:hypothetical protein
MNREETIKIFSVMKANYPNFYKSISRIDAEAQVNLWNEMFLDTEYALVGAAVKSYIATDTSGYPPNVGKINEFIRKLTQPEEMTEQEAVSLILKATRNGIYGAEEEFNKLPPVLQRLAGSPEQIKAWAIMDADELQTVVASNLMRSYRVVAKNEREMEALPSSVKQFLIGVSDKLKIEGTH